MPLQAPEALQLVEVGLLTLQVSVTTWPTVVAVGVALMLTTGVVVALAWTVDEPLPALLPLPPPQALKASASTAPAR
ncbi:hypothetical protein RugamoR1_46850 [Rugamonas sp. R1(2021)]